MPDSSFREELLFRTRLWDCVSPFQRMWHLFWKFFIIYWLIRKELQFCYSSWIAQLLPIRIFCFCYTIFLVWLHLCLHLVSQLYIPHTVRRSIHSSSHPHAYCAPKVVWWLTLPLLKVNSILNTVITYSSCHMWPPQTRVLVVIICEDLQIHNTRI